jgi:hypothetical protein
MREIGDAHHDSRRKILKANPVFNILAAQFGQARNRLADFVVRRRSAGR